MDDLAIIRDALERCDRILRDTIRLEMSPAAWDDLAAVLGDPDWKPSVQSEGPIWTGLPGEHPLLNFIRAAIAASKRLQTPPEAQA